MIMNSFRLFVILLLVHGVNVSIKGSAGSCAGDNQWLRLRAGAIDKSARLDSRYVILLQKMNSAFCEQTKE
jgi:hypothetical protein